MKYLITEDFETNIASINTALSLPSIEATNYCTPDRVTNIGHVDYDKFIIPVRTEGRWKCDQLFQEADLVDFDQAWYATEESV